MALRRLRGSRLRRVGSRGAVFGALVAVLYIAAGAAAMWPALKDADTHFLARGTDIPGGPAAGDHLQAVYHLWLVGHQLEHGNAPWLDPYSFQPEVSPRINFGGWPFGLPFWPLSALFGAVGGWNAFLLLTYLGAGALAYLWLRELNLGRGAAVVGGLAFTLAPYRVAQSTGHFRGPISMLLPLALFALERARRGSRWWLVLAGAALASIPFSDVHLAVGAVPFFCLYALVRIRDRWTLVGALGGVLAGVGAGILVSQLTIPGSIGERGRSLEEVARYSAEAADFTTRHVRHGLESFVFLGWATPVLAAAGLLLLVLTRRYGLAVVLAIGAIVPILLAFGTNLPLYSALWRHFPPLRYPRVPERQMPIAALCIAALVAVVVARFRWKVLVPVLAAVLVFFDLHVRLYQALPADQGNAAYASMLGDAPGRLLELPIILPDNHIGSIYVYYDMQAARERPLGYSTLAPVEADRTARRLRRIACGGWRRHPGIVRRLGIRYVAVYRFLYARDRPEPTRCLARAERGLREHGFRTVAEDGGVVVYERPT